MSGFFQNSFDSLPDPWKSYIFGLLDNPKDLANCFRVCKKWGAISNTEKLWNKFGVKSAQDFIKLVQHNHKQAQILRNNKINQERLGIYFLGLPDEECYYSNAIPSSLYYPDHKNKLTTFLVTLVINGYRLAPWYWPSNNQTIFNDVLQKNQNKIVVLAYINNANDLLKFTNIVDPIQSNVLMLFVTTDSSISETIPNAIFWEAKDDIVQFYTKVIEKLEQLANLFPEKTPERNPEKRFSYFPCPIV